MDFVDLQYCGILSLRLDQFVVKNDAPYTANVRCPLCGDSTKSKTKKRGWFLEKSGEVFYYCHNCFASHKLITFLKIYDVALYNQYIVDRAIENKPVKRPEQPKPPPSPPKFRKVQGAKVLPQMDPNHPAMKYVRERQIPESCYKHLYYAPRFKQFVNSYIPDKLGTKNEEPRLIFPFFDKDKNLFGFAGRSFDPNSKAKYITIMLDPNRRKVYGLDRVDFTQTYYVTEGQIDSLFLDNAMAMAGADGKIADLPNPENAVGIFDNEPRNKQIVARMEQTLKQGCQLVIWPDDMKQNDINDMVLAGIDPMTIIKENTYSGMLGELKLTQWKKI